MKLVDRPVPAPGIIPETIRFAGGEVPVWPAGVKIQLLAAPNTGVADFTDLELYHPGLAAKILEMERDPRYHDWIFKGGCGTKVRDPHEWGSPEADLIHARAMRLAARALGTANVVVDDCWANVYRKGDYCMPHSHLRAIASVVYLLDPGDAVEDDALSGRFYFCDPRIPFCVEHEPGRVTRLLMPELHPGSLLIFPAEFIHAVNPYGGERPRITLSWNINTTKLPGDRADGWKA
jgi:hypothetical protein